MERRSKHIQIVAFAIVVGCGLAASGGQAAEITLRNTSLPTSALIRLRDVADVRGVPLHELERLNQLPLMPAPPADTHFYLHVKQVRDMLAASGVDVSRFTFSGSNQVVIGKPVAVKTIPRNELLKEAQRTAWKKGFEKIVVDYLAKAAGDEPWQLDFTVSDEQWKRLSRGKGMPKISGGKAPWVGTQRFFVRMTDGKQEFQVPIIIKVTLPPMVVVANRPIPYGETIRAVDVRLERIPGDDARVRIRQVAARLEDVVGKQARRTIRQDSPVYASWIKSPLLVRRGQAVNVLARAGGIAVRTAAIAKENGSMGELVYLETEDGGEAYVAEVIGSGQVAVLAAPTAMVRPIVHDERPAGPPIELRDPDKVAPNSKKNNSKGNTTENAPSYTAQDGAESGWRPQRQ